MLPSSSALRSTPDNLLADPGHPLAIDLAYISGLNEYLGGTFCSHPADAVSLRQLGTDKRLLDDIVSRNKKTYKGTKRISANFVAAGITWAATAAPVAMMAIKSRAISPDPDETFVQPDRCGEVTGAFFQDPSFCVLSADPAAAHPRAHVVEDAAAMYQWMRVRLVAYLMPVIENLSALSGLGQTGLWGQVAASWGSVITWSSELSGYGDGVREAEAFLHAPGRPFSKPPSFLRIERDNGHIVAMRRGVCCLAYKLSEQHYCGTCPLITDEERTRRFCSERDLENT